jgi:hypothetical protein
MALVQPIAIPKLSASIARTQEELVVISSPLEKPEHTSGIEGAETKREARGRAAIGDRRQQPAIL